MKKSEKRKKAQSEVISTMLLIMLAIAAVAIVIGFVIPFVRNQLEKSDCFDYAQKLDITNDPVYTCYYEGDPADPTDNKMNIQVHMGEIDEQDENFIRGFKIILETSGNTEGFIVKPPNSEPANRVFMNTVPLSPNLELPGKNGARAYSITGVMSMPNSTKIYPILNDGKECSEGEYSLEFIQRC